jgi:DNA gyrase inhibitor GyrI
LTECEGRDVAVLSFSGRFHQSKSEKLGERLKGMVVEQGLTPTQEPILAVYDGPMTLPFKRRNEILLPVERVSLN